MVAKSLLSKKTLSFLLIGLAFAGLILYLASCEVEAGEDCFARGRSTDTDAECRAVMMGTNSCVDYSSAGTGEWNCTGTGCTTGCFFPD